MKAEEFEKLLNMMRQVNAEIEAKNRQEAEKKAAIDYAAHRRAVVERGRRKWQRNIVRGHGRR